MKRARIFVLGLPAFGALLLLLVACSGENATMVLSPTVGPAGTPVHATITGHQPTGNSCTLFLDFNSSEAPAAISTDQLFSTADFEMDGVIPPGTPPGTHAVDLVCADGYDPVIDASAPFTVTPPNHPPVAAPDRATTDEDTAVSIPVRQNDTDPDDEAVTLSGPIETPARGEVTCGTDACIYTPEAGFPGTFTFTYRITDGGGLTSDGTVTVTVTDVLHPPVAVDDAATTDEDTSVTVRVLANDSDPDGDFLSISGPIVEPARGTVFCDNGDSAGPTPPRCVYTPEHGARGTFTFTYRITDSSGLTDDATVTVTVTDAPEAPIAQPDLAATAEDTSVTIDVLANDSDPDGDALAVSGPIDEPAHGRVTCTAAACTYEPEHGFLGRFTFTYRVTDPGGLSDDATVTVTVSDVPETPIARPDLAATDEDTSVTIDVLANDSDPDGDAVTLTGPIDEPAHGAATCTAARCTYKPRLGLPGTFTFTYRITDPGGLSALGTVTVTVADVLHAPVAVDDTARTDEDTPVAIPVLVNDSDADREALTATGPVDGPARGAVTCAGAQCVYTPELGFPGTFTFTYRVTDPGGLSDIGTVTVTVADVLHAPVAVDDLAATDEDTAATVPVLVNDTDADSDPLTVTGPIDEPAHGVVSCAAAQCTYTPEVGFPGTYRFTYRITDPTGRSDEATVTVVVEDLPHAPVAIDDAATTDEDTRVPIPVLRNDTDADGDPLVVSGPIRVPTRGHAGCSTKRCAFTPERGFPGTYTFTYRITDPGGLSDEAAVTITVADVEHPPVAVADDGGLTAPGRPLEIPVLANDTDPDGRAGLAVAGTTAPGHGTVLCSTTTCTYQPAAGFSGPDRFTYFIKDPTGLLSAPATVTVRVQAPRIRGPVPIGPVARDDVIGIAADDVPGAVADGISIDVLANDSDADSAFALTANSAAAHGTVDCSNLPCVYRPEAGFTGQDGFTYTIVDPTGLTDVAAVSIGVGVEADRPPVAEDDRASVTAGRRRLLQVLANDHDPEGEPVTITEASSAVHGRVACGPKRCFYTPERGYSGADRFTYTITDGKLADAATVRLRVTPRPPPPPRKLRVVLSRPSVSPGSTLVIKGQGCSGSAAVPVSVDRSRVTSGQARGNGTFAVDVAVPSVDVGRHQITVRCGQRVRQVPIDVVVQSVTPAANAGTLLALLSFFILLGLLVYQPPDPPAQRR